jgi:hypothetical protein
VDVKFEEVKEGISYQGDGAIEFCDLLAWLVLIEIKKEKRWKGR